MPEKDKVPHTKKRVSKACDCCRKSKTKCDGQRPCTRCLQDGKICTYMNKKKADQMYPASYVDLLETRVSILVQSLNQLLNKSKKGYEEFEKFCSDPDILNGDDEFDINKVICKLLTSEKLDNLAESSESYSLYDITHVAESSTADSASSTSGSYSTKSSVSSYSSGATRSNSHPAHPASSNYQSSPSPTNTPIGPHNHHNHHAQHHHYSLSKVRRKSDNHVHKLTNKKHPSNSSNCSLVSSFQTRFNMNSPDSYLSKSSNSLDITNQNLGNPSRMKTEGSLESLLCSEGNIPNSSQTAGLSHLDDLEIDNINFSDSNSTSTLMSPVHSSNDDLNPELGGLANGLNIEDILLSKPTTSASNLNFIANNSWNSFNDTSNIKLEDSTDMGFSWNLPQYTTSSSGIPLKFDSLFD